MKFPPHRSWEYVIKLDVCVCVNVLCLVPIVKLQLYVESDFGLIWKVESSPIFKLGVGDGGPKRWYLSVCPFYFNLKT